MPGFSNGTMYADNVDFTGGANPAPKMLLDGQVIIGNTGTGRPTINTLTAGPGIAISNGPGSITISNTGAGPAWTNISASQALVSDNGYICTAPGGALVLSLPATSAFGTEIEIYLYGAASFQITQGAGQQIELAQIKTTLGAGGSLTSTGQGDSLRMLCVVPDLFWVVLSGAGNPIIV
jgi:hypothetical protein